MQAAAIDLLLAMPFGPAQAQHVGGAKHAFSGAFRRTAGVSQLDGLSRLYLQTTAVQTAPCQIIGAKWLAKKRYEWVRRARRRLPADAAEHDPANLCPVANVEQGDIFRMTVVRTLIGTG